MKILRVIASMDPSAGGPCQGIRNSIPELEKLGAFNEVVSLDHPSSSFLGKDNFIIHALGPAKSPWHYNKRLLPWLEHNLARFDAVIVHGLWLYPSHAAMKALQLLRNRETNKKLPRLFVMPHGMLDPYFQRAESRKIKALRNWLYWKFVEALVVNNADGVLFTCQAELELARIPFRPYKPKAELNVGYGIPGPQPFGLSMKNAFGALCPKLKNRPYILFLGRIHEKKGVDILLNAYRDHIKGLKNSFPELVIAGPGMDSAFGKQLKDILSQDTLLDHNVFLPGMLTGDAKWGAFYGASAFILPSHQENFGIAVVEALACAKPVLISDQVNIWKEIWQEGAGIICPDTYEGVSSLLHQWMILSEDQKATMAGNALVAYQKYFSIIPAAQKLKKTLESY